MAARSGTTVTKPPTPPGGAAEARERRVPALGHPRQLAARDAANVRAPLGDPVARGRAVDVGGGEREVLRGAQPDRLAHARPQRGGQLAQPRSSRGRSSSAGAAHPQPRLPPYRLESWPSGGPSLAVCLATFMLLLDVTIVNVALPSIERDLDACFSDLQWVVDAYALTLAAFLLTAGSIADLVGRRRVFVAGVGLFTRRLAAVRPRRHAAAAQPRPRAAGRRRRDDVRVRARAARDRLPGPRPRDRVRRLGRGHRRRRRRRPAGRRRAHGGHRLGGDLLRQRPDRRSA